MIALVNLALYFRRRYYREPAAGAEVAMRGAVAPAGT
jgi:hypothetical protein